ncbi:MAG: methyltransferase, partial [Paracoccaceae bacterium]|nr:methyltransferase [Paracoccaceae bacterium]
LGVAFIRAAGSYMGPSGVLWMVANRHLPYDAALAEALRDVEDIGGDRSYRLIRASRPTKPPRK